MEKFVYPLFLLLLLLLALQPTLGFSLLSGFLPFCPFFTLLSPLSYSHYLRIFFSACSPSLPCTLYLHHVNMTSALLDF